MSWVKSAYAIINYFHNWKANLWLQTWCIIIEIVDAKYIIKSNLFYYKLRISKKPSQNQTEITKVTKQNINWSVQSHWFSKAWQQRKGNTGIRGRVGTYVTMCPWLSHGIHKNEMRSKRLGGNLKEIKWESIKMC